MKWTTLAEVAVRRNLELDKAGEILSETDVNLADSGFAAHIKTKAGSSTV